MSRFFMRQQLLQWNKQPNPLNEIFVCITRFFILF